MKRGKGFTLVEIIVVILIIAILVAFAVPALTGYVDDARDQAGMANARSAYLATQTVATREYTRLGTELPTSLSSDTPIGGGTGTNTLASEICRLSGWDKLPGTLGSISISPSGQVTSFEYTESGKKFSYTADKGWAEPVVVASGS